MGIGGMGWLLISYILYEYYMNPIWILYESYMNIIWILYEYYMNICINCIIPCNYNRSYPHSLLSTSKMMDGISDQNHMLGGTWTKFFFGFNRWNFGGAHVKSPTPRALKFRKTYGKVPISSRFLSSLPESVHLPLATWAQTAILKSSMLLSKLRKSKGQDLHLM
jgi:hypothetical protein